MTINIDFDGTCVTHDFPKVGKSIGAEKVLKRLADNGHQLILFTMRSDRKEAKPVIDPTIQNVTGKFLTDAVNWFKENNIPLYGIQKKEKFIFERSGLNQWNANGRKRDFGEIYIPIPELQFLRDTFLSSYTEGKKKNQFTKVQMNIEADRILLKYFSDNLATVESWFNVISPSQKSLIILKDELDELKNKNWQNILI